MGLLSIFQRKSGEPVKRSAPDPSPDAVQEARTRARRRLIGAAVLVLIGVVGFPLLFETQPRPIPVDIPIEIPRKDNAPPLVMPAARPGKPVAAAPTPPIEPASSATVTQPPIITEAQADAGRELPAPTKPGSTPAKAATGAVAKPAEAESPKHAAAAKPAPSVAVASLGDAKRAQALLEGKATEQGVASKDGGRFVVQVGAFADASAARETRQKVEKLGLKTYTQVAETSAGSRIRVRVGPFATRDEADRALAKIKAAGTPAVVLTL